MSRVLITGSRKVDSKEFVYEVLRNNLKKGDLVVHGGASGVDSFVKNYCEENSITQRIFRPINKASKSYYLHRNAEMVGYCDKVIGMPYGNSLDNSRGTWFTINYAKARGKSVKVVTYDRRN